MKDFTEFNKCHSQKEATEDCVMSSRGIWLSNYGI